MSKFKCTVLVLSKALMLLNLYYAQVVFRIRTLAGPEQKVRAGSQEPENGGSHKRTASRGRQNQSSGVTLYESCAF